MWMANLLMLTCVMPSLFNLLTFVSTIMPPTITPKVNGPTLYSTTPTHGQLLAHLIQLITPSLSKPVVMPSFQHTTSVSVVRVQMSVTFALTTTTPQPLPLIPLHQCCLWWIPTLTGISALSCNLYGRKLRGWLVIASQCHLFFNLYTVSLSSEALFPTTCLHLMATLGYSTLTSNIKLSCNKLLLHIIPNTNTQTSGRTFTNKTWPVWLQLIVSLPIELPDNQQPTKYIYRSWKKLSTSFFSSSRWFPLSPLHNLSLLNFVQISFLVTIWAFLCIVKW